MEISGNAKISAGGDYPTVYNESYKINGVYDYVANLKISGGTIEANKDYAVCNYGNLEVTQEANIYSNYSAIDNDYWTKEDEDDSSIIYECEGIAKITGGEIKSKLYSSIYNYSKMDISENSVIKTEEDYASIYNSSSKVGDEYIYLGELNISGGTVQAGKWVAVINTGILNISDNANIIGCNSYQALYNRYKAFQDEDDSTIEYVQKGIANIKGGSITNGDYNAIVNEAELNISGGTIINNSSTYYTIKNITSEEYTENNSMTPIYTATGGTIKNEGDSSKTVEN